MTITKADIETGVVIPVDKPLQWSSFQVVNKIKWQLRRAFGLKKLKIGHAGTLDPMASGLLLVCVGPATKRIEELQQGIKAYEATVVFGATTPCYDLERTVDRFYPTAHINKGVVEDALAQFRGTITQVPPMFSAVKVGGERAYVAARGREAVELKARQVTIEEFTMRYFRAGKPVWQELSSGAVFRSIQGLEALGSLSSGERKQSQERELYRAPQGKVPEWLPQADLHCVCSKGTYIRSLARDLGVAVGSGAFLSALRRTRVGSFTEDDAMLLSEIDSAIVI